jgi:DNA-binding response OmpR family regulator
MGGLPGDPTMTPKTKILVVDDDRQLVDEVKSHLEALGYEVIAAADGSTGLKLAQSMSPDLVVLDINFPCSKTPKKQTLDGIEVLRRLRESGEVPILMVSVTNIAAVRVMALSIGADDYLAKPVDLVELDAHIKAILRRTRADLPGERFLGLSRLQLDPGERRVWKDGDPIELTETEFDVLYALARRPEHVFSRNKIFEVAWRGDSCCVPKAVDVHIGHLRKKIEDDPNSPAFIVTVRGVGYRFEDVPA